MTTAYKPEPIVEIDGYGRCADVTRTRLIIFSYGVTTQMDNGALVFRYPWEGKARRVNPIFVSGVGWLVPLNEVKP